MISFYPEGDRVLPSDDEMRTLHKIASLNGAGSGGSPGSSSVGAVQVYEGRDPAPPDDVTKAAINFPVGGGPITQWSGGAWV